MPGPVLVREVALAPLFVTADSEREIVVCGVLLDDQPVSAAAVAGGDRAAADGVIVAAGEEQAARGQRERLAGADRQGAAGGGRADLQRIGRLAGGDGAAGSQVIVGSGHGAAGREVRGRHGPGQDIGRAGRGGGGPVVVGAVVVHDAAAVDPAGILVRGGGDRAAQRGVQQQGQPGVPRCRRWRGPRARGWARFELPFLFRRIVLASAASVEAVESLRIAAPLAAPRDGQRPAAEGQRGRVGRSS